MARSARPLLPHGDISGSDLGSILWLSTEPVLITADLNEWVRFDQPGEYRLTVKSKRVDVGRGSDHLAVASNEVLLNIVAATPEWQEETLRQALAVLAKSAPDRWPHQPSAVDPAWDAIRTIRFLGTPAAAREMAHRVSDRDCLLGLAGSPAREAALDEMNKLLRDTVIAVDGRIKLLMSVLATPNGPGGDRH